MTFPNYVNPAGDTYPAFLSVGAPSIVTVAFTRPANATAYSALDAVNRAVSVTAASNASPIVVTATAHGLADGDIITISGVTGNTNANATSYAKVTGYTVNTFALYSDRLLVTPVAGNGTFGGTAFFAQLFVFKNIFRVAGGSGKITKVRIVTDLSSFTDALKLHFYGSPTVALLDNAVYTMLYANRAARLGNVVLPALATEGTGSDCATAIAVPGDGTNHIPLFVYNSETVKQRDLYIRIQDLSAGTPASAQNFYIEVTVDCN